MGFKPRPRFIRRDRRYRLVGKSTADNLCWFPLASYATADGARRAVEHWFAAMSAGLLWEIQLRGPGLAVYNGPHRWVRSGKSFVERKS